MIIIISETYGNEQCSFNDINKVKKDENFYILKSFDKFSDLKFNCSQSINISMLGLKPDNRIILDKSLNFTGLVINPTQPHFAMVLHNLKGFGVNSNPFRVIKKSNKFNQAYLIFSIDQTNFDFFDDQNIPIKCENSVIKTKENLFTGTILSIGYDTKLKLNTCPLIFSNINLGIIELRLSSSFIDKNILGFEQNQDFKMLNSTIYHVKLMLYHTDLNSVFLNKYVFEKLTILDLNGQITNIQQDLFKNFKRLGIIRFQSENIQNVLVRNNKWFVSLNYDLIPIDLNDLDQIRRNNMYIIGLVIYQRFYNHTFYDYPDKDFCFFKDFPHNKLVFPKLRPNFKTKCSCTELFLIQYSQKIGQSMNYFLKNIPSNYYLMNYYLDVLNDNQFTHCYNRSFEKTIEKCNFKQRLNLCNIKALKSTNKTEFYFYMNDWKFLSRYTHLIFSIYINVIFSFVSILFNILILIVSSKNMPKEFNRMYSYLKINSCLNIIYIIIRLFKLIDNCSSDDIICTTINSKSQFIQYFKIIFIRMIGNTFQTASNLTQITFTLSRYITITNNKSFLSYIHIITHKKYIFILLVLSLVINIFTYFTFTIRKRTLSGDQLAPMDQSEMLQNKQDSFMDYKERFTHSEYLILDILKYIKIIFSDIFYILIIFTVDLILLFYVRKKMIKKEQLTIVSSLVVDLNRVVLGSTRTGSTSLADDKKKKINSLKNRITLMIILNGINFLIFRLPLSILSFYGFLFRYDYDEHIHKPNLNSYLICRFFRFCISLEDFFYFCYLVSFIIQFFIFFKLDKNLQESFRKLRKNLKEKIQNSFKINS